MSNTLPMPEPAVPLLPLQDYKVLSFDIYGTLIEYKGHILNSFRPLISRLPATSPYRNNTPLQTLSATSEATATVGDIEFLKLFQKQEDTIKLEKPLPDFGEILTKIWLRVAEAIEVDTTQEEAAAFGSKDNIASWPAFPGTMEALQILSRHYKLVALSNIDRYTWDITCKSSVSPLADVTWWKVFTAEDYGDDATKADDAKLETLVAFVEAEGIAKRHILHVAQSLGHDHAPAKRQGLASVFLEGDGPKWGKEAESKMALEKNLVGYGWRCKNLREFAGIVDTTVA